MFRVTLLQSGDSDATFSLLQLFVKAGAGANGVGKPSGGVILDKYFDL